MRVNELILNCILIFVAPVLSQYSFNPGLRPDVTFGDHNDRFDLTSLIDYQNKYFRAGDTGRYRRNHGSINKRHGDLKFDGNFQDKNNWNNVLRSRKGVKKLAKKIHKETARQINDLANEVLLRMTPGRRFGDDAASYENAGGGGGDIDDVNENLEQLFLKLSRSSARPNQQLDPGYRKIGSDVDIFEYAFPIDMKVKGFLVAPVDE